MSDCLICSKESECRICDDCIVLTRDKDGLAAVETPFSHKPTQEQLDLLNAEITSNPQDGRLLYWKGLILNNMGNFEESLMMFEKATRADPEFLAAWIVKGTSLKDLGRYREALRAYRKASELDPNDVSLLLEMGNCFREEDMLEKAIDSLARAKQLDPDNVFVLYELGESYNSNEDFEDAITVFKEGLAKSPDDPRFLKGLATAYHSAKMFDEALKIYLQATEVSPKDVKLWIGLGDIYLDTMEYTKSIEAFEQALTIQPTLKMKQQGRKLVDSIKSTLHLEGGIYDTDRGRLAGAEATRLLNQATKAFNEGLNKSALNSLREVSRLSEEAMRFYQDSISKIEEDLKLLQRNNVDTTSIEEKIAQAQEAFKSDQLANAFQIAKEAQTDTENLIKPLVRQEATNTLEELNGILTELKGLPDSTADLSEAEGFGLDAQTSYSEDEFIACRDFAQKAVVILKGIYREYYFSKAEEAMAELDKTIGVALEKGIDIQEAKQAQETASESMGAGEYKQAIEQCSNALKMIDDIRREHLIDVIKDVLGKCQNMVGQAGEMGVNVDPGTTAINTASEAFRDGRIDEAEGLSLEAERTCSDLVTEGFKQISELQLDEADRIISGGEKEGLKLDEPRKLYDNAKTSFDDGNYELATNRAKEAAQIARDLVSEHFQNKSNRLYQETQNKIGELGPKGVLLDTAIQLQQDGQNHFGNGDFIAASNTFQACLDVCDEAWLHYMEQTIVERMNGVNEKAQDYKGRFAELDLTPLDDALQEVKNDHAAQRIDVAFDRSAELEVALSGLLTTFFNNLNYEKTERAKEFMEQVSKLDADLKEKEQPLEWIGPKVKEVIVSIEAVCGKVGDVEAEVLHDEVCTLEVTVNQVWDDAFKQAATGSLKNVREVLTELAALQPDVSEFSNQFASAKPMLVERRYQDAIDLAAKMDADIKAKVAEVLKEKAETAIEVAMSDIEAANAVNADASAAVEKLDSAKEHAKKEEFKPAIEEATEASRMANEVRENTLKENTSAAMVEVQDIMVELQQMGVDVSEPGQLMGEASAALQASEFEKALGLAVQAKDSAHMIREQAFKDKYNALLQEVKGRVDALGAEELDVSDAHVIIEEGLELVEKVEFDDIEIKARDAECSALEKKYDKLKGDVEEAFEAAKKELDDDTSLELDVTAVQEQFDQVSTEQEATVKVHDEMTKEVSEEGVRDDIMAHPELLTDLTARIEKVKAVEVEAVRIRTEHFTLEAQKLQTELAAYREELAGIGVDLAASTEDLLTQDGRYEKQEFRDYVDNHPQILEALQGLELEHWKSKTEEHLGYLDNEIKDAEEKEVDVSSVKKDGMKEIKKLKKDKDFKASFERTEQARSEVAGLVQTKFQTDAVDMIKKAREVLALAKDEGVDIAEISQTFLQAKPQYAEGDYTGAMETAKTSWEGASLSRFTHFKTAADGSLTAIADLIDEANNHELKTKDYEKELKPLKKDVEGVEQPEEVEAQIEKTTFLKEKNTAVLDVHTRLAEQLKEHLRSKAESAKEKVVAVINNAHELGFDLVQTKIAMEAPDGSFGTEAFADALAGYEKVLPDAEAELLQLRKDAVVKLLETMDAPLGAMKEIPNSESTLEELTKEKDELAGLLEKEELDGLSDKCMELLNKIGTETVRIKTENAQAAIDEVESKVKGVEEETSTERMVELKGDGFTATAARELVGKAKESLEAGKVEEVADHLSACDQFMDAERVQYLKEAATECLKWGKGLLKDYKTEGMDVEAIAEEFRASKEPYGAGDFPGVVSVVDGSIGKASQNRYDNYDNTFKTSLEALKKGVELAKEDAMDTAAFEEATTELEQRREEIGTAEGFTELHEKGGQLKELSEKSTSNAEKVQLWIDDFLKTKIDEAKVTAKETFDKASELNMQLPAGTQLNEEAEVVLAEGKLRDARKLFEELIPKVQEELLEIRKEAARLSVAELDTPIEELSKLPGSEEPVASSNETLTKIRELIDNGELEEIEEKKRSLGELITIETMRLRKAEAVKKVEEIEKELQELVSANIREDLTEYAGDAFDPKDARELVGKAKEAIEVADLEPAMVMADSIMEKAGQELQAYMKLAAKNRVASGKKELVAIKKEGYYISKATETFGGSKEKYSSKDYQGVLDTVAQALKEAQDIKTAALTADLSGAMGEYEKLKFEAEKLSIDISHAEDARKQAEEKGADELEEAVTCIKRAVNTAQALIRGGKEKLTKEFDDALAELKEKMSKTEEHELEVGEINSKLEKAEDQRLDDILKAGEFLKEASSAYDEVFEKFIKEQEEAVRSEIEKTKAEIATGKEAGSDVTEAEETLAKAEAALADTEKNIPPDNSLIATDLALEAVKQIKTPIYEEGGEHEAYSPDGAEEKSEEKSEEEKPEEDKPEEPEEEKPEEPPEEKLEEATEEKPEEPPEEKPKEAPEDKPEEEKPEEELEDKPEEPPVEPSQDEEADVYEASPEDEGSGIYEDVAEVQEEEGKEVYESKQSIEDVAKMDAKKEAMAAFKAAKDEISKAKENGADVKALEEEMEEIQPHITMGEFHLVLGGSVKVMEDAKKLHAQAKRAKTITRSIELTRKKINAAPAYLNLKKPHGLLDEAHEAIEAGEVDNAHTFVSKAKFAVKKIANQYVKVKTGLSLSKTKIDVLKKEGIDTSEAEKFYDETEKQLDDGDYDTAILTVKKCIDECVKQLEAASK